MLGKTNLTQSEVLNIVRDRGVGVGESFSLGLHTFRVCMTEHESLFVHVVTDTMTKTERQPHNA
ncbi:MAG: hypothetical protein V4606_02160 [Patescibacteria group bacterium]